METVESINLITRNPEVRGGRPCIMGTGLKVSDIVMAQVFHGQTPDAMAVSYGVTLAQVYAALAYYYLHKDEIDSDIRDQIEKARELRDKHVGSRQASLLSG
ncbi:MAG: DUF433 domain-containing protein [Chloroflexi bacterium]|nr:DUF433 domain-containing protein [Chloroflexota bacterium]